MSIFSALVSNTTPVSDGMESLFLAPACLQSNLYRIDYAEAQTTFDPTEGFVATYPTAPTLDKLETLHLALLSHDSWAPAPSPFISMFADERHARNWALARGDISARMMVIGSVLLPAGQVLRAVDAYRELGIQVPAIACNKHEYLCMNRIPAVAVTRIVRYRQEHLWRIDHDPHYHHDVELGWYDSDDESELRNTNKNLAKMMEGDW